MNLEKTLCEFTFELLVYEMQLMSEPKSKNNLSYNSSKYLEIIRKVENCTISDLAKILRISKAAATSKVNELEKQGYVVKTQSETDKRVYYLSAPGEIQELCRGCNYLFKQLEEEIAQQYTQEEIDSFCHILNKLTQKLEQTKCDKHFK